MNATKTIRQLVHPKSRWERVLPPVAGVAATRGVVKSGLVTLGTMVGVTAASAVVSAVRHSREQR